MTPRGAGIARVVLFCIPFVLAAFFVTVKCLVPRSYERMIQEDHLVEYAQSAIYFLASMITACSVKRFFGSGRRGAAVLYVLLAVGLMFVACEEISWGQRLFNLGAPELFRRNNYQQELTIHNMAPVQGYLHWIYIAVGFYGSFLWLVVPHLRSQIPTSTVRLFVPDWYISSYFIPVFAVYSCYEALFRVAVRCGLDSFRLGGFFVWRDQEPAELILALGFLLFALNAGVRQTTDQLIESVLPS
ncbi:MAG: hypothetical protein AB1714_00965 [Acidobacteriota bacterium]